MSIHVFKRLCVVLAAAGAVTLTTHALHAASLVGQPQGQPQGQPPGRGQGGREGGRGGGEGASVEGAMKTMNRALRQLRGQIDDASKKEESIRLVNEMQQGCLAAKRQPVPGGLLKDAADDAAKEKLRAEFRHELIELMRALLVLEEDLAAGKMDSARSRLTEIVKMRDHAHEELGVEDEGNPAQPGEGNKDRGGGKGKEKDNDQGKDKDKDNGGGR